jgi:hypothetical protein
VVVGLVLLVSCAGNDRVEVTRIDTTLPTTIPNRLHTTATFGKVQINFARIEALIDQIQEPTVNWSSLERSLKNEGVLITKSDTESKYWISLNHSDSDPRIGDIGSTITTKDDMILMVVTGARNGFFLGELLEFTAFEPSKLVKKYGKPDRVSSNIDITGAGIGFSIYFTWNTKNIHIMYIGYAEITDLNYQICVNKNTVVEVMQYWVREGSVRSFAFSQPGMVERDVELTPANVRGVSSKDDILNLLSTGCILTPRNVW